MSKPAEINRMHFGVSSMVAPLRSVAMRAPGNAILNADPKKWHYAQEIAASKLLAQYQAFVTLIEASGAEILWLNDDGDGLADSIFTYDPSLITPAGAILMNPGKNLRKGEVNLHAEFYNQQRIPVIGRIETPARAEGGDCLWLDDTTLALGQGFRTNQAGIEQLSAILGNQGIKTISFDMPVYHGEKACLHLMSVVSSLSENVALVYAPLMPVQLYQTMCEMGYTLLEAPTNEFEDSGGLNLNVLATEPMKAIAIDGFSKTLALMRGAGCEVAVFDGDELCTPCEGGPTCMTRPVLRG